SPIIAPASCKGRRESCTPKAIAFPTSPARWYRSSISLRSRPLRTWLALPNPLRFRGNLYVSDWPAWCELDLIGKELGIGRRARLKVVKRIKRRAATNGGPDPRVRDLEVPQALTRHLGHGDCGVYAEVVKGGEIAQGDNIEIT